MSSYFDALVPCFYEAGGVRAGFCLDQTANSEGHRTALHEFPFSDSWVAEQFGAIPQKFSIQAHVIGYDWMVDRDALIAALRHSGPGKLVLSRYGALDVRTEKWTVKEDRQVGRAEFSIDFVKEGRAAEVEIDRAAQLASAVAAANKELEADYGQRFNLTGALDNATAKAVKGIDAAVGAVDDVTRAIQAPFENIAKIQQAAGRLKASARGLLRTPAVIASQFISLLSSVTALVGLGGKWDNSEQAFHSFLSTFARMGNLIETSYGGSRQEEIARTCNDATRSLATLGAGLAVASLLPSVNFGGRGKAERGVARYMAFVDEFNLSENAQLHRAFTTAASLAVVLTRERVVELSWEASIYLARPRNALELSAELGTTVESLERLNRIPNPLLVSGGIVYAAG